MSVNQTLKFRRFDPELHIHECSICGRKRLKKGSVVAVFHPNDSHSHAAPYCHKCVARMSNIGAVVNVAPEILELEVASGSGLDLLAARLGTGRMRTTHFTHCKHGDVRVLKTEWETDDDLRRRLRLHLGFGVA